ncbi:MAG: hypothetical protein AAGA66_12970 [Bacteroidota bacterium]
MTRVQRIVNKFLLSTIILVLYACNESKEVGPATLGYDFYPVALGQFRIYEVEEIQYDLIGFDTSTFQLRETIFDSIVSGDRISYLIRRDKRNTAVDPWESDSVWQVSRTDSFLSITENNVPFIKLVFPVTVPQEWNGNSLNVRDELIYYYQPLRELIVDTLTLSDHIRVIIEDIQENVTGVDLRSEIYVRGVGLVEKDYFTQTRCTSSNCGDDLGEVDSGRLLKQRLIEIGNE